MVETDSTEIKFSKDENGNFQDTLEFNIKGNLVFYWDKEKSNSLKRVKLGKVREKLTRSSSVVEAIVDTLTVKEPLTIKVINHMDFGTIVVGSRANAKTPAEIEVGGSDGSFIQVTIPKTVDISNKSNDKLTVELKFKDKTEEISGEEKFITETIKTEGKTDKIIIDGSVNTSGINEGVYEGKFTVRVRYI